MRNGTLALLALLVVAGGRAQVSGYASSSYGYHSNPLANYATTSDHTLQGYWQVDYLKPSPASDFKLGYLGGLMVFQDLAPRNYYEHRATIDITQRYPSVPASGEVEGDETPFRGNTLELRARLGARHDRAEFQQFDNWGGDVSATYTRGAGTLSSVAFSNETGLRRYAKVPELDNLTTVFSLRSTSGSTHAVRYSVFGGAGIKHYLTSEVDTSVFTTYSSSSGSVGQGQGKGRGKGGLSGTGNGKKDLLVNATSVNTFQLHAGAGIAWQWEGGSAQSEVLYRFDPGSSTRVLAQYTNSTLLSEDLYNDFFSHSGPEIKMAFRQNLPLGLNVSIDALAQRRKFLSPAFTLDGVVSASSRVDLRGEVEISLTRWIAVGESLGIDVGVNGGVLRNQSNDAYNDFSGYQYSLVVGMGF